MPPASQLPLTNENNPYQFYPMKTVLYTHFIHNLTCVSLETPAKMCIRVCITYTLGLKNVFYWDIDFFSKLDITGSLEQFGVEILIGTRV